MNVLFSESAIRNVPIPLDRIIALVIGHISCKAMDIRAKLKVNSYLSLPKISNMVALLCETFLNLQAVKHYYYIRHPIKSSRSFWGVTRHLSLWIILVTLSGWLQAVDTFIGLSLEMGIVLSCVHKVMALNLKRSLQLVNWVDWNFTKKYFWLWVEIKLGRFLFNLENWRRASSLNISDIQLFRS